MEDDSRNVPFKAAAVEVLKKQQQPLNAKNLVQQAKREGLLTTSGRVRPSTYLSDTWKGSGEH